MPPSFERLGRAGVGADVLRQLAELLVRDVEPVLAAEGKVEVVARDARDLLRLEAEELADAVVLVHDVVADPEVGKARERPAEPPVCARRSLPEDLRVGEQDEAELPPHEAPARRRDREAELGLGAERLAGLEERRLDLAQERGLPLRLAAMRERDDDAVPGSDEARELVLGLCQSACGDGGSLRLERVRLRLRERVELGGAVERDRCEALLLGDAPHVVGLPDEVGWAADRRRRGRSGHRRRTLAVLVGRRGRARRDRRGARPPGRRPRGRPDAARAA